MPDPKPYRHRFLARTDYRSERTRLATPDLPYTTPGRFPLSVIGYAVWLYHRFPLSQRDVQELLFERGIVVSHEPLRQWNIKFAPLLTEELRHREPRRGSRWPVDEVCVPVGGTKHGLWRAVDEHGAVLDILLQPHWDTEAARTFFTRLLSAYEVPEVMHTDKLWSYQAALKELPVLHTVEHVQVASSARCNNLIEQSHRPTRQQERQRASVLMGAVLLKTAAWFQAAETRAKIPEPARQNRQPPPSHQDQRFRHDQKKHSETSVPDVVNNRGRVA